MPRFFYHPLYLVKVPTSDDSKIDFLFFSLEHRAKSFSLSKNEANFAVLKCILGITPRLTADGLAHAKRSIKKQKRLQLFLTKLYPRLRTVKPTRFGKARLPYICRRKNWKVSHHNELVCPDHSNYHI